MTVSSILESNSEVIYSDSTGKKWHHKEKLTDKRYPWASTPTP